LRVVDCAQEDFRKALAGRTLHRDETLERVVSGIIESVRTRGDEALLESARRFDAPGLTSIRVPVEAINQAQVEDLQDQAIRDAYARILRFHERQMQLLSSSWTKDGRAFHWQMDADTELGQRIAPLARVGLYVPGGGAAYPSSVLMLAGPARAAGVPEIVLCSPAHREGSLPVGVLVAAREAGIAQAFMVGGAAAIAAMAFGTESVPRVDKIAGPGNRYVNEAKRQLWGSVGLDGFAGPSEVCVLADDSANPRFAAADLLTQIEHAPDNAAFLVCLSHRKLEEILTEVERQLASALREETMRKALKDEGCAFVARCLDEAIEIVNEVAPEHLTLAVEDPVAAAPRISSAGCILMGEWTPESAADYCLGPSHTLPTGGAARFGGPVNVLDFLKVQSFANLTREQFRPLARMVEVFGEMEGLPTHAAGATVRLES
jgi:histidinol dehydrogenase